MSDTAARSATEPGPKKSTKKSDLGARLITALVSVPILIYAIFASPPYVFGAIVLFAAAVASWEFINITLTDKLQEYGWVRWLGAAISTFLFAVIVLFPHFLHVALTLVVIIPLTILLFAYRNQGEVTEVYGSCISGVVYGTLPISCLALLQFSHDTSAPIWIFITLGITWGSDTFAYFGGRAFGKRKLSPKVSPNKTIEGAVSGLFGSFVFAVGLNYFFAGLASPTPLSTHLFGQPWLEVNLSWHPLSIPQLLILIIPANIVSQIGDLAESLIKRAHKVKDSGVIVYGHGGILDRIDGVMFATPWVYFCATFLFQ